MGAASRSGSYPTAYRRNSRAREARGFQPGRVVPFPGVPANRNVPLAPSRLPLSPAAPARRFFRPPKLGAWVRFGWDIYQLTKEDAAEARNQLPAFITGQWQRYQTCSYETDYLSFCGGSLWVACSAGVVSPPRTQGKFVAHDVINGYYWTQFMRMQAGGPGHGWVYLDPTHDSGQGGEVWRIPEADYVGDPVPGYYPVPLFDPDTAPKPMPQADPFVPPGSTEDDPRPVPWRWVPRLVPFGDRVEQTERGPVGRTEAPGYLRPASQVELVTGARTRQAHARAQVKTGDKERKWIASPAASSLLGMVIGGVTEGLDAIYAVYDALPEACRRSNRPYAPRVYIRKNRIIKRPPPQEALDRIYNCFEALDFQKAAQNLIVNELEDRAIGYVGRKVGQASRRAGSPFGYQVGPAL